MRTNRFFYKGIFLIFTKISENHVQLIALQTI